MNPAQWVRSAAYATRSAIVATPAAVRRFGFKFGMLLDSESIVLFQVYVYYPLFVAIALYLWLAADAAPQPIEDSMGALAYNCWLALSLISPLLTLVGKRLYGKAAHLKHGEPNSAYGGALMQFWGDFGVWGSIIVYLLCVLNTSWWGRAVYAVVFVFMGVPGGFFFTARSWRRLRQIRQRAARG